MTAWSSTPAREHHGLAPFKAEGVAIGTRLKAQARTFSGEDAPGAAVSDRRMSRLGQDGQGIKVRFQDPAGRYVGGADSGQEFPEMAVCPSPGRGQVLRPGQVKEGRDVPAARAMDSTAGADGRVAPVTT